MKRVNPKWIKILDEIEKWLKWGLLSIFLLAGDSEIARYKLSRSRAPTRDRRGTGFIKTYK
ncbi:hypothetical protein [Parabacteroides sp. AF48-14]|uniref:hypothetical protein n=1 Tax=Parabacteroides sp. AF48-14 TaxID=2292052 RepID=UPI0011C41605|nr:hypothetical protein [Parabacteroides sp. AF48-14]